MSSTSIEINIAGISIPLTVEANEVGKINALEQEIHQKIEQYKQQFTIANKQALLSMVLLDYALSSSKSNNNTADSIANTELAERLSVLNSKINSVL